MILRFEQGRGRLPGQGWTAIDSACLSLGHLTRIVAVNGTESERLRNTSLVREMQRTLQRIEVRDYPGERIESLAWVEKELRLHSAKRTNRRLRKSASNLTSGATERKGTASDAVTSEKSPA